MMIIQLDEAAKTWNAGFIIIWDCIVHVIIMKFYTFLKYIFVKALFQ